MGKAQVEGFECVWGRRGRPGDANAPINVNPVGGGGECGQGVEI